MKDLLIKCKHCGEDYPRPVYHNDYEWHKCEGLMREEKESRAMCKVTDLVDDIIEFTTRGFEIHVPKMEIGKRYRFRFDGSRYEIWRHEDDALEVLEVA